MARYAIPPAAEPFFYAILGIDLALVALALFLILWYKVVRRSSKISDSFLFDCLFGLCSSNHVYVHQNYSYDCDSRNHKSLNDMIMYRYSLDIFMVEFAQA